MRPTANLFHWFSCCLYLKMRRGEHLEVLSKLAGKFSQKTVREALMAAVSAEEVRNLLTAE